MNCDQARLLLGALQDGELSADKAAEIEEHLIGCAACSEALERQTHLSEAIRTQVPYFRAPERLMRSVPEERPAAKSWKPFSLGLGIGLAAALAFMWLRVSDVSGRFAAELVGDHTRSLASHLVDVESTDRHTVKPWFAGKLDFSPNVVDLATDGFPLTGGRLEYLGGRPAAALVYRRQKHIINVFVLPDADRRTAEATIRGFHVLHWKMGDLGYWAVSDVAEEDLRTFSQLFQSHPAP